MKNESYLHMLNPSRLAMLINATLLASTLFTLIHVAILAIQMKPYIGMVCNLMGTQAVFVINLYGTLHTIDTKNFLQCI